MKSPFKLLEPFTEKDRESFFGRNTEIEEQYDLVRRSRLMIVHGLSGTGKTSLLRCGLYNEFDGPDWYPLFIRTGTNINESINQALATALKDKNVSEDNVENIVQLYERTYRPPYLILDQFEEFFILPGNTEEVRQNFMHDIRRLLDTGIEVRVIFVLREEFLGEFYPYEAIVPELFDVRFRVERMTNQKVREVVRDSFAQFNIGLEEPIRENLDKIVENISSEGLIDLPYLQIYLDELYDTAVADGCAEDKRPTEHWPRVTIRRRHIEEIGDIKKVLRNFLEGRMDIYVRLYRDKPDIPTDLAQRILISMVTDHGTKVPVRIDTIPNPKDPRDEIIIPEFKSEDKIYIGNIDEHVLSGTIKKLIDQQIIRRRPDSIEIAHDSLAAIIAGWKTDEEQHLRVLYRRIQTAYVEYEDSGNRTLMSDALLDAIEMDRDALTGLEDKFVRFIENSVVARNERRSEEVRRQKELKVQRDEAIAAKRQAKTYQGIAIVSGILMIGLIYLFMNQRVEKKSLEKEALVEELAPEQVRTYLLDTLERKVTMIKEQSRDKVSVLPGSFELYSTKVSLEKSFAIPRDTFTAGSVVYFYVRLVSKEKANVNIFYLLDGNGPDEDPVEDIKVTPNSLGYRFFGGRGLSVPGNYKAAIYEWQGDSPPFKRSLLAEKSFVVVPEE